MYFGAIEVGMWAKYFDGPVGGVRPPSIFLIFGTFLHHIKAIMGLLPFIMLPIGKWRLDILLKATNFSGGYFRFPSISILFEFFKKCPKNTPKTTKNNKNTKENGTKNYHNGNSSGEV